MPVRPPDRGDRDRVGAAPNCDRRAGDAGGCRDRVTVPEPCGVPEVCYERPDTARDLARAEASLRGTGAYRGRRRVWKRPQTGWLSLTPTKRRIANLVVEGLPSPQIGERLHVSFRTVQTHLAHDLRKAGHLLPRPLAAEVSRK